MILSAYGTITYDGIEIANILKCPAVYFDRMKNKYQYVTHRVEYGIRADYLAYSLYGNSNLQWIFSVLNPQIKDGGFNDWLLNQQELYEYTKHKYSQYATPDDIHHHEDADGRIWYNVTNKEDDPFRWFNADDDGEETLYTGVMIPRSNLEYERDLNDDKFKIINIVQPNDINNFVVDFIDEVRKGE